MIVAWLPKLQVEEHDVHKQFALVLLVVLAHLWRLKTAQELGSQCGKEAHELSHVLLSIELYLLLGDVAITVYFAAIHLWKGVLSALTYFAQMFLVLAMLDSLLFKVAHLI